MGCSSPAVCEASAELGVGLSAHCAPPAPRTHSSCFCCCQQICPILSDLMGSMSKIESLPPDFGPKGKVKGWYSKLYAQAAAYELGEGEVRQLLFDLESAYNEFISTIR